LGTPRVTTGITAASSVLGGLLHLYAVTFKSEGEFNAEAAAFLTVLFLWSLAPYATWLSVALIKKQPAPAVGACLATLAADLYWHYSVFIAPQASTAALGLLVAPFWNLVLVGPLGAAVSWPVVSFVSRRRGAA
jgi:hypothetical protein